MTPNNTFRKQIKALLPAVLASALAFNAYCADAPQPALHEQDVLAYLQEVISWRRAIVDGDLPVDNARIVLLKDALRRSSQKVLKSSFDFARAESLALEESLPETGNEPKDNGSHSVLFKKVAETKQHIEDLESQLEALSQKAPDSETIAQREKINSELKVERAHQELLNSFVVIFSSNENDAGLTGGINKLYHTVESDLSELQPAPKTEAKESAAAPEKEDSILGIGSDIFSLSREKKNIDTLIDQTDELNTSNQNLIKNLRGALQESIKEGLALADAPVATDKKSLAEHHRKLDDWQAEYKQLSATVVPLGQINALLSASTGTLREWDQIISQEWNKVLRHFVMRFGIFCASLFIPFAFLELAHRMIVRYVRDISRIRQLNIAKQAVFAVVLILVVFLNFFTEFGSLATYAGFLTAGLAVALQTVLVSLTAHFFFFGRFGVRAGDRVTIAGVTGDVVQVGMLRIYLMELIGEAPDLRPSGKIVAFPNSVLFNSTAFSKQIAGTNYAWNDLAFQLDPKSDFSGVSKKILEVVNGVYKEYKDTIERQHIHLRHSTNLSVDVPTPKSEIHLRDAGMVCEVHYPVIIERTAEIYEKIIKKLIEVFEADKNFTLVLSSPFRIVAA